MILLPIVTRELKRATRRKRTYRVRVLAAMASGLVGWLFLSEADTWQTSAGIGRELFQLLSGIAFWSCLAAGFFTTSICLSQEKRAGTLGLLFLTDLKGFDVVLGKLSMVSLNSAQTAMGIFPVLAICLILGGVSAGEFWRMGVVLLNTLFFSLSAGMFVSSFSRRTGRAIAGAIFVVVALAAGLAGFDHFRFAQLRDWGTDYVIPGPFQAWALVWDQRFGLPPHSFWPAVGWVHFTGWAFLALASRILPRTCMERPYRPGRLVRMRSPAYISEAQTVRAWARRKAALRVNPVYWLAYRGHGGAGWLWFLLGGTILLWLAAIGFAGFRKIPLSFPIYLSVTPALHMVLALAIAAAACRRFSEKRWSGELELLLSTPLTVATILQGEMKALKRRFSGPVAAVLATDLWLLVCGSIYFEETGNEGLIRLILIWGMMIMLVINAHGLAWVGLWEGLTAKNSFAALRRTLGMILLLPWAVCFFTLPISPPALVFAVGMDSFDGWMLGAVIWWWFTGFLFNYGFYLKAERAARGKFRLAAAEPYPERSSRQRRRDEILFPPRLLPGWLRTGHPKRSSTHGSAVLE